MKLAVFFPGIGYHVDKPLLYYSKKLATQYGYETISVPYRDFPKDVKGSPEKMKEAFEIALFQTRQMLAAVDFARYQRIVFVSKSVGTAVAGAYAAERRLQTDNIYYTPVAQSFPLMENPGIVFHGTADSWVETAVVQKSCEEKGYPLFITEGANHSLETGDALLDLQNLAEIMRQTQEYLEK